MPANVESYVGRESAWHRLGKVFGRSLTVAESLAEANMTDWNVRTAPMYLAPGLAATDPADLPTAPPSDGLVMVDTHRAIIRDNPFVPGVIDHLGVAGAGYSPIQNETAFDLAEAILDANGDAVVETMGSLDGGKQVFACLKMPEGITIGGNDHHDLMLAICTSHDGSMALHAFPTAVRIVCQNTFKLALHMADKASTYKVRHTASSKAMVQAAREALSVGFAWGDEFTEAAELLLSKEMADKEFDKMIAKEFAVISTADTDRVQEYRRRDQRDLANLFRTAETQDFGRGTRYAAFNAITEWSEWVRPRGDATNENNSKSVLFGNTAQLRQKAWNVLQPA